LRKVLITGGSGRIGKVLVKAMLQDGHHVAATCRDRTKYLNELGGDLKSIVNLEALESNFFDKDALDKLVSLVGENTDTLIHNARSLETLRLSDDGNISTEDFNAELFMSVVFPYRLIMTLIRGGLVFKDIVFISSIYGIVVPNPLMYDNFNEQSFLHYGVAKSAQIQLTKELAVRLAPLGVRVNCISYGGVSGRSNEDFERRYSKLNPMSRMLNDGDLYPPLKFFLDNEKIAMTGENMLVDGGWTLC
jgi:NAD(P)-dependent dehydrogenase (short-subunit alcohol dehydrogenase family)